MKVLMFGWEFPKNIWRSGSCIMESQRTVLAGDGDYFLYSKTMGERRESFLEYNRHEPARLSCGVMLIGTIWSLVWKWSPEQLLWLPRSYLWIFLLSECEWSGMYGILPVVIRKLHEEINNFSIIAGVVARQQEFDIIHAHDWLTYPAGVHAKMVAANHWWSMCMQRTLTVRGKCQSHSLFYQKNEMDYADCIMCIELTRRTVINEHHGIRERYLPCIMRFIRFRKELLQDIPRPDHSKEKRWLPSSDVSLCRKDRNILWSCGNGIATYP